jgi:hypothetical protein
VIARRAAVATLATLALAVAGCGGSDSNDAAGEDSATVATAVEESATQDTSTMEDTSTLGDASGTATVGLGTVSKECLSLAAVGAKYTAAIQAATGGTGDVEEAAKYFDELVETAPDAIKADLETLSGVIAKYAEALQGVDLSSGAVPDAKTMLKLQKVQQTLSDPKYQQASKDIESWAQANCTTK